MNCALCGCRLFPEDEQYDTAHGRVDVLCYRSLELLGRVWE